MTTICDGALSFTPHYYKLEGRAAEIARALGSPAGGAEHFFLGMLHEGGWPVDVITRLGVDHGRAEEAVLAIIGDPGYSQPVPPQSAIRDGYVQTWGAQTAREMGDSYIGVEHALLAMIRARESVPARALAGLADLGALEAAVLRAKNSATTERPADAVFLPEGQELDESLVSAIVGALPDGTTFGFNTDPAGRQWLHVIGRGPSTDRAVTIRVINDALASLGRPLLDV
jgi:ATP-dependent Clp protease ATP-binding subunit ClpA